MDTSLDLQEPQNAVSGGDYDVVVVGAGPYGLSTMAHLQARGLKAAIFGKPLELWRNSMPQGMLLRSFWWGTNLSDPQKKYGLAQYFQAEHQPASDPFSREEFINYAMWFQKHAVPNVDETYVASIERKEQRFEVTLVDGRVLQSSAVVMAPGLAYFFWRAPEYEHLSPDLVSHTADHVTFERFAGRRIAIIGGGQSALETAALAHESGAEVLQVSRRPIAWLQGETVEGVEQRSLYKKLRYPKAGIAPGWFNWGIENFPYAFQQLSREKKDRLLRGRGRYGPAGASWLKDRILGKVNLFEMQQVQTIKEVDNGVELGLSDGATHRVEHVILGTGYCMDITKLPMLHASLVAEIQTYQDAPILSKRFESTVPGLYFLGYSSVSSCGPLYRFVVGTEATARQVASAVTARVAQHR